MNAWRKFKAWFKAEYGFGGALHCEIYYSRCGYWLRSKTGR